MAATLFLSPGIKPPNGGAAYHIALYAEVLSQNVSANTSDVEWIMRLVKDRSFNGFYGYSGPNWTVSVGGVMVSNATGTIPSGPWPGWTEWLIDRGVITLTHDDDGNLSIPVGAQYTGPNSGWAIGHVEVSGTLVAPSIPRATTPTVSPSPAVVAADVTISMPYADPAYTHDVTWVSGSLSGTIGTGLGDDTTWTVPDVMGEYPGQALAPIVITVVTKNGGTTLGTKQVTLFVKEAPVPPVIVPHDPDKQFDIRVREVKYEGGEWAAHTQLPANTIKLVDPASATATCELSLSKLNFTAFEDFSIVDVDIFDGENWVFTNHRFVLSRSDGDDIDPTRMGNYSGTEFVDFSLSFAYTQKDYEWTGVTPGKILADLIADARGRGWGPRIDHSFTASATSLDETWANPSIDRKVSKGTPISQVLDGLVTDGLVEYKTAYHTSKAWLVLLNPGTGSNFADVGADPVVNLGLANLSRAPRRATVEKRFTRVTVTGDDQLQVTREKSAFDSDVFGAMEGWVSASGVATEADLQLVGDNALRDNQSPVNERTFEYDAQNADPQFYPYSIFVPGDWVLIPESDSTVTDRISQVTAHKTADNALSLTVLTGDRILSGTASLAKRQNAQSGGSISGGNGTSPSPLDSRIPAGPVIDEVTSEGYWNLDGAAKSAVTLSWGQVANALNGTAINVDLYEVWWRPAGIDTQWSFRGSTDELEIVMGDWDPLIDIEFRVRARSAAGIYGEFSEDIDHTTLAPGVDIDGPDLADLYTDGVGNIFAVWGGTLDGAPAPSRLAYVQAEISSDGGTTYVSMGTPITAAGTIVINPGTFGDFMVRLRGYDRLGNAGDVSDPQSIGLVDPHVNPPAPEVPTGLAATSGVGWDASGFFPEAWFDLEWDIPTDDVDGNPINIIGYDVWGQLSTDPLPRFLTSTSTNSVRITVNPGETWSFQVKAASEFGGVSQLSDAIVVTADATVTAAPAPDAPTLDQYAGLLRIRWSGNGMLPQIKYVYAAISTSGSGPFTRAGMPLQGAGEVVVPGLATDTDYYAQIVMVDELGNTSTSDVAGPIHLLPITGVTIQTSPLANTGIKITDASLTAYDNTGVPTFILDAVTGEVWIAPYDAVFELGAPGTEAETGSATTGIAISSQNSSFNTFIHPSGVQIRNDQTPLSWWEADAADASLVNFVSPRARVDQRLRVGDYEMLREAKTLGSRLVIRYKGA